MDKYKLYVDRKVSLWNREWYEVEANSLEEAIERCVEDDVEYSESEDLYETITPLTPEENNNSATIEVFQTKDDIKVYDNVELKNDLFSNRANTTV